MLMTESEVATYLRCSRYKVKRLRLTGRLTYLSGRPVLVEQEDLLAYIASEMRSKKAAGPPTREVAEAERVAAQKASCAAAAMRARETWLQMKLGTVKRGPNRSSVKS